MLNTLDDIGGETLEIKINDINLKAIDLIIKDVIGTSSLSANQLLVQLNDAMVSSPLFIALRQFLGMKGLEGTIPQTYLDSARDMTVGIGLNLANPSSEAIIIALNKKFMLSLDYNNLKTTPNQPSKGLDSDQIDYMLLQTLIGCKEKRADGTTVTFRGELPALIDRLGALADTPFQPYQLIALQSLAFNANTLIGSNLISALNQMLNSGSDIQPLIQIMEYSNGGKHPLTVGLQNRRLFECGMFHGNPSDVHLTWRQYNRMFAKHPHLSLADMTRPNWGLPAGDLQNSFLGGAVVGILPGLDPQGFDITVYGSLQPDKLTALATSPQIFGGGEDDVLTLTDTEAPSDDAFPYMAGNLGSDVYQFGKNPGQVLVYDFDHSGVLIHDKTIIEGVVVNNGLLLNGYDYGFDLYQNSGATDYYLQIWLDDSGKNKITIPNYVEGQFNLNFLNVRSPEVDTLIYTYENADGTPYLVDPHIAAPSTDGYITIVDAVDIQKPNIINEYCPIQVYVNNIPWKDAISVPSELNITFMIPAVYYPPTDDDDPGSYECTYTRVTTYAVPNPNKSMDIWLLVYGYPDQYGYYDANSTDLFVTSMANPTPRFVKRTNTNYRIVQNDPGSYDFEFGASCDADYSYTTSLYYGCELEAVCQNLYPFYPYCGCNSLTIYLKCENGINQQLYSTTRMVLLPINLVTKNMAVALMLDNFYNDEISAAYFSVWTPSMGGSPYLASSFADNSHSKRERKPLDIKSGDANKIQDDKQHEYISQKTHYIEPTDIIKSQISSAHSLSPFFLPPFDNIYQALSFDAMKPQLALPQHESTQLSIDSSINLVDVAASSLLQGAQSQLISQTLQLFVTNINRYTDAPMTESDIDLLSEALHGLVNYMQGKLFSTGVRIAAKALLQDLGFSKSFCNHGATAVSVAVSVAGSALATASVTSGLGYGIVGLAGGYAGSKLCDWGIKGINKVYSYFWIKPDAGPSVKLNEFNSYNANNLKR